MTPVSPDERVIFLHVPKTGGYTLSHALRRHFPSSVTYTADVTPESDERDRRYLEGQLDESGDGDGNDPSVQGLLQLDRDTVDRLRLFLGHFWFGVDRFLPGPSTYVTVVRDPVDRLLSLHHHRVTQHGLQQTVEEWVRAGRELELHNGQTRRLAGDAPPNRLGPCTQAMFDVAHEHVMTRFAAVGVTERYEESMVALARTFGWPRMTYEWLNRSAPRADRATLSADVTEILEEQNQYDRALHRLAGACLDAALVGVDTDRELRLLRRANQIYLARRRARGAGRRVKRAAVRLGGTHR